MEFLNCSNERCGKWTFHVFKTKSKQVQEQIRAKQESGKEHISIDDANWICAIKNSTDSVPLFQNSREDGKDVVGKMRRKRKLPKRLMKGRIGIESESASNEDERVLAKKEPRQRKKRMKSKM